MAEGGGGVARGVIYGWRAPLDACLTPGCWSTGVGPPSLAHPRDTKQEGGEEEYDEYEEDEYEDEAEYEEGEEEDAPAAAAASRPGARAGYPPVDPSALSAADRRLLLAAEAEALRAEHGGKTRQQLYQVGRDGGAALG